MTYNVSSGTLNSTIPYYTISKSTFLNHETDWFESQQFSQFCILLSFIKVYPHIRLIMLSLVLSNCLFIKQHNTQSAHIATSQAV